MNSLFEEEEKKVALSNLKLELISRYHSFSKEDLLKYRSVLNFDRYHLMDNPSIQWDVELLEEFADNIDWSAIYKLKNLKLGVKDLRRFEDRIDFSTIHLARNLEWSNELFEHFGERMKLSSWVVMSKFISSVEDLRRLKDVLDWGRVSQEISIELTHELIDEFYDKWDWKGISKNSNQNFTGEFIKRYVDKIDFNCLSGNPRALPLIYKYPASKRWNWELVILNPSIVYDKSTFDWFFFHYKQQHNIETIHRPLIGKMALFSFLYRLFYKQCNDIRYFLQEEFLDILSWENLCKNCNTELEYEFILTYKEKLNFKEPKFVVKNRHIITADFLDGNVDMFDPSHYSFYSLPISQKLVAKIQDRISWNSLSASSAFEWSWDFIFDNLYNLNYERLIWNKGIYDQLLSTEEARVEIYKFLDEKMAND